MKKIHFLLILAILSISGCFTEKLYLPKQYTVEINSFLLSEDKKFIVATANGYNYIFQSPEIISNSVASEFGKYLDVMFGAFTIKSDGSVSGMVWLYVKDAPDEYVQKALSMGYKNDHGKTYTRTVISGNAYISGQQHIGKNYTFKIPHNVLIYEEKSTSEKAKQLPMTPVTVLADGAVILFGFPLLVVVCTVNPSCLM